MAAPASPLRLRHLGYSFLFAGFLTAACGGKSSEADDGNAHDSGATGGASAGTGGSQGGTSSHENGGDTSNAGTAELGGSGGTDVAGKGGADAAGTGGSSDTHCKGVICEALPNTCKKIVQKPDDCCPTCPDTGCDKCPDLECGDGTHPETAAGDCCPSCVEDPPDACAQGLATYAQIRDQLIDKYGSSGCNNSSECGLVQTDNACEFACAVALPSSTLQSYASNMENAALGCSSCPPAEVPPMLCDPVIAACVNGHCTAQPE